MPHSQLKKEDLGQLRSRLLHWYLHNQRNLPWRHSKDPYSVWVSEIMLQQTRVAAVIEKYKTFLSNFPTIASLAEAPEQKVLALWSGLGYYRRARMLHKAAQLVMKEHHGRLPTSAKELLQLPGIGAYTAAAIASIAHDEPVAAIDGNVERVVCRLLDWEDNGRIRGKIKIAADTLLDPSHAGDFNQAMMELGATICTPRSPQCATCPWLQDCRTRGEHKKRPRPRMQKREVAYALCLRIQKGHEEVLLQQRPQTASVMPGLWELPSLHDTNVSEEDLRLKLRHAIMQVNYQVSIRAITAKQAATLTEKTGPRRWVRASEAREMALTGLTRKVLTRTHLLAPVAPLRKTSVS